MGATGRSSTKRYVFTKLRSRLVVLSLRILPYNCIPAQSAIWGIDRRFIRLVENQMSHRHFDWICPIRTEHLEHHQRANSSICTNPFDTRNIFCRLSLLFSTQHSAQPTPTAQLGPRRCQCWPPNPHPYLILLQHCLP